MGLPQVDRLRDWALPGLLTSTTRPTPPWPVRLLGRTPLLQRIPARLLGMGFRPEHIRTRAA